MGMEALEYHKIDKKNWDKLVWDSPEGWLYQTSTWIDYAEACGTHSISFGVVSETGELLAVCPLYTDPEAFKKFYRRSRLDTGYSGPALAAKLGQKTRKSVWKFIFEHIDKLAQQMGADVLRVRLTNVVPAYQPPLRSEINPLWTVGVTEPLAEVPSVTLILDLVKSEEQLLKEMDGDCRAAIKQAERGGLQLRIGNSQADIELYAAIHEESWTRTGMTPHNIKHFTDMQSRLGDQAVFMFAEVDGQAVAGMIIHVFKEGAFYWGGCSKLEALKLRPNNFLLWSAIKLAKAQGCKWFEVGQFHINPQQSVKEYNVGRFKAQFGKEYQVPFEGQKHYTRKSEIMRAIMRIRTKKAMGF